MDMYMGLFIVDADHSRERASGRWGEEGEGPGEGVWVRLARVEGDLVVLRRDTIA